MTNQLLTAEEVLLALRENSIESSIPGATIKFAHFYKDQAEGAALIRQFAEQECAQLRAENLEQARLLGISGSKEAKLLAENEALSLKLATLGDLAVGAWDDEVVGAVDEAVPHTVKYKDQIRTLFDAVAANADLRKENDSLATVCAKLKESLGRLLHSDRDEDRDFAIDALKLTPAAVRDQSSVREELEKAIDEAGEAIDAAKKGEA